MRTVAELIATAGPDRLDGVHIIGVDEHRWAPRHLGADGFVTLIIDLTPTHDQTGPARRAAPLRCQTAQPSQPSQTAQPSQPSKPPYPWSYPWQWGDLGWNTIYVYDWSNAPYWNSWCPVWRNTCRWRCPTNDNGPYSPDVEAYLDAHPDVAAEFARVHGYPWEQRRIQIEPFLDSHADVKAWFDNRQPWI
jgi:hemophore-related protein